MKKLKTKNYTLKTPLGFSLIEFVIVMAIIIIIAAGTSLALFRFTAVQETASMAQSIRAVLRDAAQRSLAQAGGMYWGVRFDNVASGRDSYVLVKSPDPSGNGATDVSIAYMRNNLQFDGPPQSLKIMFDKMTGNWLSPFCPSGTAYAAIGVNGISTHVYCNGKIE